MHKATQKEKLIKTFGQALWLWPGQKYFKT
jgi:hypothetical protein